MITISLSIEMTSVVTWFIQAEQQINSWYTIIEGLISWRQVYMVRSGIFPWFSFALLCISNTYACHVRMIMVIYAYMFYLSLTYVMVNQGIQCEDFFSCHAQEKCKPQCQVGSMSSVLVHSDSFINHNSGQSNTEHISIGHHNHPNITGTGV